MPIIHKPGAAIPSFLASAATAVPTLTAAAFSVDVGGYTAPTASCSALTCTLVKLS
jgi:hypothetical protein